MLAGSISSEEANKWCISSVVTKMQLALKSK